MQSSQVIENLVLENFSKMSQFVPFFKSNTYPLFYLNCKWNCACRGKYQIQRLNLNAINKLFYWLSLVELILCDQSGQKIRTFDLFVAKVENNYFLLLTTDQKWSQFHIFIELAM